MSEPKTKNAPSHDVTIRLATKADSAAISRVLLEAFSAIREHYTDEAFKAVTPAPDEIKGRFAEGPMWVAELFGEVVGTVSLTTEPEGLYVRSMAVLPNAQGHGIGRKLLDELHEHAAGSEIERIFLYTLPFQTGARAIYEKHGYTWVRDTSAEEWYGVPGLEMEKEINT
ncbi:MAG: GNAT family N-acetyltransferase [Pyrinomonadaceae bacterium]